MSELKLSITQHYHERTKYDEETIASKSQSLDWSKQPSPFKEYKLGKTTDLKPYLQEETTEVWWRRLSRLLLSSYGLTARVDTIGAPIYLRAAPSAGGLYPAEIYLISRGTPLLPPGLYNYQAQTHSLVHFWESEVWQSLQSACCWHPVLQDTHIAIAITAVFQRSAWRYQDRAYRRIFLDTGHLLGNIELAGSINDFRPHLIGGFVDEAINNLLYLDADTEGTTAIIGLADLLEVEQNLSTGLTALPSQVKTDYPAIADGQLLPYYHKATAIESISLEVVRSQIKEDKYNFPFCLKVPTISAPIDWSGKLVGLEQTIFQRRSTRAYNGENLTLDELIALLDFTYQPQNYIHQELDGAPDYFALHLIETFIAVSGVEGLESGCYYYAPKVQELRQIRFKNFRRELHFLCLGQDLGRDAAAVLFHTADLQAAITQYGDRVYRYLHMDAGHLGQRLNLAAIRLDLGVSGIAGFFDDRVNEILGIPVDEAAMYITTLGRPR